MYLLGGGLVYGPRGRAEAAEAARDHLRGEAGQAQQRQDARSQEHKPRDF